MASNNKLRLALIILSFVVFIITIIINVFSTSAGQQIGLFLNKTAEISSVFDTRVTPAGWTFSVWGIIYAWQSLLFAYMLTSLCRKKNNACLYTNMSYLPNSTLVFYTAANCCNIIWLFLWDRQLVIIALPFILLIPICLCVALFMTCRRLSENVANMVATGMTREVWLTRFLVHNALAVYITWTAIASLLNLAIVLTYRAGASLTTSGLVSLSIVSVEVITWNVLDILVLDRFTRYIFSPYIVTVLAFSGILSKNYNTTTALETSVFTVVILTFAIIGAIVKVAVMVYRHIKLPNTRALEESATPIPVNN